MEKFQRNYSPLSTAFHYDARSLKKHSQQVTQRAFRAWLADTRPQKPRAGMQRHRQDSLRRLPQGTGTRRLRGGLRVRFGA